MANSDGFTGVVATLYYPEFKYTRDGHFRIHVGGNCASVMFLDEAGAKKLIEELKKVHD